jgi:hypothetical protein
VSRRGLAVALGLSVIATSASASPGLRANAVLAADAPITAFVLDSDPGNWVGQGLHTTFSEPSSTFSVQTHTADTLLVSWFDGTGYWSATFQAAPGAQLVPGVYDTDSWFSENKPKAQLSAPGRGCNRSIGYMRILEYQLDAGGELLAFAGMFGVTCDGSTVAYGELRVTSTVPWSTAAVSTTDIAFPSDPVASGGVDQVLTVTSGGTGPLTVEDLAISGADAGAFTIPDETCTAAPVATGATCTITVRFTASSYLEHVATLTIGFDAARRSVPISLHGYGTSPLSVTGDLDFGLQQVYEPGPIRTVTLHWVGDDPLVLTSFAIQPSQGDATRFSVTSQTCTAAPVATGGSCTVSVRFSPVDLSEIWVTLVAFGPAEPAEGTGVAWAHGRGDTYAPNIGWTAAHLAGPSYTWNDGFGLGRTRTSTGQYLHAIGTTDRVGGKWVTNTTPKMGVVYTRSTTGTTWSSAVRLNPSTQHGYWASLAASGTGVYAVWVSSAKVYGMSATAPRVMYFRRSTSHGASGTWSTAKRVTSTTGRIDAPVVAASGFTVLIAWTDAATGSIKVAVSKDRGSTFKILIVGTTTRSNGLGRSGLPVIAVSGTTAIVAWLTSSNGGIRARLSANGGSSWGTATVTSNAGLNSVPAVAAASGRAALAFSTGTDLYVRVWKGSWSGFMPIDPGGSMPELNYAPALAFNGTSNLAVAWAACRNDCSSTTSSTRVDLLWAETKTNGAAWSAGQAVALGFETSSRHVNDFVSILWSTKRELVWNGWTPGTNAYRLYHKSGTTIAGTLAFGPSAAPLGSLAPSSTDGGPLSWKGIRPLRATTR